MVRQSVVCLIVAATLASASSARAEPGRVIVLRHGEKQDAYRLCGVGEQRGQALAGRYLGRDAAASLFAGGSPDAFMAITLHTLELASPSAVSWRKPLLMYSALPQQGQSEADATLLLNQRTQEAAASLMNDWSGKTVVMVWEHHHIADEKLAASFPDQKVTLRQLLNLDALANVPKTWPGDNYDYFWIVDYDGSNRPPRFQMLKQSFTGAYASLPSNDWGAANKLPQSCVN
jgi:hypothetical protein